MVTLTVGEFQRLLNGVVNASRSKNLISRIDVVLDFDRKTALVASTVVEMHTNIICDGSIGIIKVDGDLLEKYFGTFVNKTDTVTIEKMDNGRILIKVIETLNNRTIIQDSYYDNKPLKQLEENTLENVTSVDETYTILETSKAYLLNSMLNSIKSGIVNDCQINFDENTIYALSTGMKMHVANRTEIKNLAFNTNVLNSVLNVYNAVTVEDENIFLFKTVERDSGFGDIYFVREENDTINSYYYIMKTSFTRKLQEKEKQKTLDIKEMSETVIIFDRFEMKTALNRLSLSKKEIHFEIDLKNCELLINSETIDYPLYIDIEKQDSTSGNIKFKLSKVDIMHNMLLGNDSLFKTKPLTKMFIKQQTRAYAVMFTDEDDKLYLAETMFKG